jgi:histidinol dehydrogenase
MAKTYTYPDKSLWQSILQRPTHKSEDLQNTVKEIFNAIAFKGDEALKEFTFKFDKVQMDSLLVSEAEFVEAENILNLDLKLAIQTAYQNIKKFHEAQKPKDEYVHIIEGIDCWRKSTPIDKVGLYVPGGTAPLFSTVLMLGIPAVIAGCEQIILCTPPNKEGKIHPAILYAAKYVGVHAVYKVGGIQAIGALTIGTETIPGVYKIFGPGNQYVTAAKQMASLQGVAIDMPAGPSEVLVFADGSGDADFIASDLLSQAEHGVDSQVVFVTTHEAMIKKVQLAVEQQLEKLPRKEIAEKALQNSLYILLKSDEDALKLINEYAPEHLILCSLNEEYFIQNLQNAGSVFLGNYTPESAGDYASGTNHTLPTNGYARSYSGVSLDSYFKKITFQKITTKGIQLLGKTIEIMAENECLEAHKNAVSIRLKKINDQ